MKILACANHKGGVAKSTTVRALGDVLAKRRVRTLLVDSDHQGSLSMSCGIIDANPCLANVYNVGQRDLLPISKIIREVKPYLDIAPASLALASAETEILSRPGHEFILADALDEVADQYDIVIIDCPPALGQLVINAICAADSVLIPTPAQPVDMAGVQMFLKTVTSIRSNKRLNPNLTIFGILITFWVSRSKTHKGIRDAMVQAGWPVLPMAIPRTLRVAESAALGESIMTFEPNNPAAEAYEKLGEVVIAWQEKRARK